MFAPRSHFTVYFSLLSFAVAFLAPASSSISNSVSAASYIPAAQARHGLTGNYYTSDDPTGQKFRGGVDFDEFKLPLPQKQPDAVRVDQQVAFGKDQGFLGRDGEQLVWWTPENAVAVIWKGYIHLPRAGTFYFTTVSFGASAIYLNEARVALNGIDAGNLPSDAFTYDPAELKYGETTIGPSGTPGGRTYVVPVTVDRPRDFPIEVHYAIQGGQRLLGIDLLWVTPDAKRDASGKPIADIVPSDALYVDAPGPIDKSVVHGANSSISSDFLYFPATDEDKYVTLTICLADENGRPIAGKHVHVSPLANYYPLVQLHLCRTRQANR